MSDGPATSAAIKSCCAALYASDWARLLLGDSLHPSGLELTERLGVLLRLEPEDRVLDVASGAGASAIFLAQRFGCRVVGIDYGAEAVAEATERAKAAGLKDRVTFRQGDAEALDLPDARFEVVVCECAFCTFRGKTAAASEFARVLRRGGRVGLSDLTRNGALPEELQSLLGWIACLADARPVEEYVGVLSQAGFVSATVEVHDDAVRNLVRDARAKLLGAELLAKIGKAPIPGGSLETAKGLARAAEVAIQAGLLGYALVVARKDPSNVQ